MKASKFGLTETYNDVEKLIYFVCHRFRKKYGGEFDELLSEANEIYMDAYRSHDPERGPFHKHLQAKIWGGMISTLRKRLQRNRTVSVKRGKVFRVSDCSNVTIDESMKQRETIPFDERKLYAMSRDARFIVDLARNPTREINFLITCMLTPKITTAEAHRRAIIDLLRHSGWNEKRIIRAFNNARKHL